MIREKENFPGDSAALHPSYPRAPPSALKSTCSSALPIIYRSFVQGTISLLPAQGLDLCLAYWRLCLVCFDELQEEMHTAFSVSGNNRLTVWSNSAPRHGSLTGEARDLFAALQVPNTQRLVAYRHGPTPAGRCRLDRYESLRPQVLQAGCIAKGRLGDFFLCRRASGHPPEFRPPEYNHPLAVRQRLTNSELDDEQVHLTISALPAERVGEAQAVVSSGNPVIGHFPNSHTMAWRNGRQTERRRKFETLSKWLRTG
jgi:hypothetical protein